LILLVLDASEPLTPTDRALIENVSSLPAIIVFNKCDKPRDPAALDLQAASCQLQVSCLTGEGIDRLRDEIREALSLKGVDRSAQRFLLNLRQLDALRSARASLDNALAALRDCVGLEFPAAEIRTAINHLRELTHPMAEEEILDAIFSRFCIGK
jgi:tRNA modification GTPase